VLSNFGCMGLELTRTVQARRGRAFDRHPGF
jgi:hypothetical protein